MNPRVAWAVVIFQIPTGFNPGAFPLKRSLPQAQVASASEWNTLKNIAHTAGIPESLLLSDYDGDGIRDFTLSQTQETVILAAEDRDWDGDGLANLQDQTVGENQVAPSAQDLQLTNRYDVTAPPTPTDLIDSLARWQIVPMNDGAARLDALVGVVFQKILSAIHWQKSPHLSALRATQPLAQKGSAVFFSWVASSGALEFYPDAFHAYIEQKRQTLLQGALASQVTQGFVIPVLVHSLAHELGHAWRAQNPKQPTRFAPWTFEVSAEKSTYLTSAREPTKAAQMRSTRTHLRYRGKAPQRWLDGYQKSGIVPFLESAKAPSIYSVTDPEEWFAEQFAMCVFRKVYPQSHTPAESTRLTKLIGISPNQMSAALHFNENCGL